MTNINRILFTNFLAPRFGTFVKYLFTNDENIVLNSLTKNHLSQYYICFGNYLREYEKIKDGEEIPPYHVILFMPTKFIEPLVNNLNNKFINFEFTVSTTGKLYELNYDRTTYYFSENDLELIKSKDSFKDIIEDIQSLYKDKEMNPCETSLVEFTIKNKNTEYTKTSLFALYYLFGVIIRAFSSFERMFGRLEEFLSLEGNEASILSVINECFVLRSHYAISDNPNHNYEMLDIINDVKHTNRVFKNSINTDYRPMQTNVITLLTGVKQ